MRKLKTAWAGLLWVGVLQAQIFSGFGGGTGTGAPAPASNGFQAWLSTSFAARQLVQGTGIIITNADGVAGNPIISIDGGAVLQASAVQAGALVYAAGTGTGTAQVATLSPVLGAYATGMHVLFKPSVANTGALTLNLGPSAVAVLSPAGTPLVAGQLEAGLGYWLFYDGTAFRVVASFGARTVFGRSGDVVAAESDYQAFYPRLTQTYTDPTWLSLTAAAISSGVLSMARLPGVGGGTNLPTTNGLTSSRAAVVDASGRLASASGTLTDCVLVNGTSAPCAGSGVTSVNGQSGPAVSLVAADIPDAASLAGNNSFLGQLNNSGATLTILARNVASLPGTCSNGDVVRLSTTGVHYYCQTNAWTAMSGGGTASETHNLPVVSLTASTVAATAGWSWLSSNAPTVNTYGEHATADFPDAATTNIYNKIIVPEHAPTSMAWKITYLLPSGSSVGQVARFAVSTACMAVAADTPWSSGAATYGAATNIDSTVVTATGGFSQIASGAVPFTCAAGNMLFIRLQRLGSDAADTLAVAARLYHVRIKL